MFAANFPAAGAEVEIVLRWRQIITSVPPGPRFGAIEIILSRWDIISDRIAYSTKCGPDGAE